MKRTRETTVAATLLIDLVRYMERSGIPGSEVCKTLDLDLKALDQPNARLAGSLMERMWQLAEQRMNDPDIGLHAAENFNPGSMTILGYVLLSCRTADEALGRLARYAALLNEDLRVSVSKEGGRTRCDFRLTRAIRYVTETMACGTLVTIRRLTTANIQPLAVAFSYPEPFTGILEHERIFGPGAVSFSQPQSFIDFRTSDLETSLLSANPALLELFDAQARLLLDQLGQHGPVSRRVLDLLARRITVAVPSLEEIASELAMSERSLQRELRSENTSFRQLIEEVRKEIALQHLSQPGALASEAAFLLGFSEPSAFTRAFRRWTGAAPTQYQAAQA
jgi:AraC-like DNA-binding protein